jgi:hypothetical protein
VAVPDNRADTIIEKISGAAKITAIVLVSVPAVLAV